MSFLTIRLDAQHHENNTHTLSQGGGDGANSWKSRRAQGKRMEHKATVSVESEFKENLCLDLRKTVCVSESQASWSLSGLT